MKYRLGDQGEAFLELNLMGDEGRHSTVEALIDTAWEGELYLAHKHLSAIRRSPRLFQQTWTEQNPEPISGLFQEKQQAIWLGTIQFIPDQPVSVKVYQGFRGQCERPRLGRSFLRRFGMVLVLDIENQDFQLLSRHGQS